MYYMEICRNLQNEESISFTETTHENININTDTEYSDIFVTENEYNSIITNSDPRILYNSILNIDVGEYDIIIDDNTIQEETTLYGDITRNLRWELGSMTCSDTAYAEAAQYYYYYVYYDYSYSYYYCCPWGGSLDGSACGYYYDASVNYYYCCPSGGSVSGSSCYYYYDASCSYYYCCPSGGTVSGASCYYYYGATPVTYGQYECRAGGSLQTDGRTCLRNNC